MKFIQLAKIEQLSKIELLYRACGQDMLQKGFDNWGDSYPPLEVIQRDIESGHLFCLMEHNQLLGLIALDNIQPIQYQTVTWKHTSTSILYIHRLAVAVTQQGKGYAKQLMGFAETHAQELNCGSIRLDAYSINTTLIKFYEQLGYLRTKEAIYLDDYLKYPFICFEKAC